MSTHIYSVPMELHIVADSPEDALIVANHAPATIYGTDGDGPHSLYVATDQADDITLAD